MKSGATRNAPAPLAPSARLRQGVLLALHVAVALGLGWLAVDGGAGVLAALLARVGMAASDAVMVAQMAACVAYPVLLAWAFAGHRPLRVVATLAAAALALRLLAGLSGA